MKDQPITTSIDNLVKYLKDHGETEANALASALNVSESVVGRWADVLEKAQIVKVNYRMGKMFVSPMVTTQEGMAVAKKMIELKKGAAQTELAAQITTINRINANLDEFKRYVAGAEGAFKNKAGKIKETIDEIDKMNLQVDSSYKKLKEKKGYIDGLSMKVEQETLKLEDKVKKTETITTRDAELKRVISDIKSKLDDSENRVRSLRSEFDAKTEDSKKNFANLLDGVRNETKLLKEMVDQQEKEVQNYFSFVDSYKKDSDAIKRQISRERSRMLDDIAKSSDEARKTYGVAEKQVTEIKAKLIEMKSQFGGYAELNDKLNNIKNSLDSISKQKDELQKQIEDLNAQLKSIVALDESKVAEDTMKMGQVEEKMDESAKKVKELGKETDNVKKGIDDIAK